MIPAAHPEWALCVGGASCVWDDVRAWEAQYGGQWDGLIIAANDIGSHWPRILDHWVSLHPNKFERWKALRAEQGMPACAPVTWGRERRMSEPRVTDRVLKPWPGGSSGMFAVQVARELGCSRIILCGIPMTPTPHFGQSQEVFGPQWIQAAGHWKAWPRQKHLMDGWVRSMSGRTRELLGAPTMEWLHGR